MDEQLRAQFAALGVDTSQLQTEEEEEERIEVWSPNWPVLQVFLACETQWRAASTLAGLVWIGLDYTAVDVVMRRRDFSCELADLAVMESEALHVLNGGAG